MLIALACAVGALRLHWGMVLFLLVGALQDPVRKLVPGAPNYLTLSTMPVWACIMLGAMLRGDLNWLRFKRAFPQVAIVTVIFAWTLVPAAVMSAIYSPGSWQVTLLGVYVYFSAFSGVLIGVFYPVRDGDIERLMFCYILIVAVMLLGAPMERMGVGVSEGWVGTGRLGDLWVTYRTGGVVRMMSGFYRSPDIMGWHASCLVMLSMILAMWRSDWQRILFVGLAGWGGIGVMLCARRKMISGLVIFLLVFLALFLRHQQVRRFVAIGLLSLAAMGVWSYIYQTTGSDREVEGFYNTTLSEVGDRLHQHAVEAPHTTLRQAGLFGYGLGMAVQGAHHIKIERPNIWQEGGLSKLLAECGVPGLLASTLLLSGFAFAGVRGLETCCGLSTCGTLFWPCRPPREQHD